MARATLTTDREPRPSVWIADDSPLACQLAEQALSPELDCQVFSDGSAVLERLAQGHVPDVLLLDWSMPGVSGAEVCRFVRATHDEVSLPILVVTVRKHAADVLEALTLGANDHVAKPFLPAELLARTRTLARTRRQHELALCRELQLAEAVRANEAELRQVTDALPVLVSFVDAEERYGFVNKAYEDWFGISREALRGRTLRDLLGDAAYEMMAPYVRRGLGGERFSFEQHGVPYRHGGTRDVAVTFVPRLTLEGTVDGYVALVKDITEDRRKEAERERLAEERNQAAARQATFEKQLIGIVSHDLRTPLSVISLGASLLMSRSDLSEGMAKGLIRMQSAAARATRMVRDLLDFTQARLAGRIPIEPRICNLHLLVDEVIAEVEMGHLERQVLVSHEGNGEGFWDPDRLKQVAENLLTNALKYSHQDTPVSIATRVHDQHVELSVHNVGEPIAADKLPVLFEPLQRGVGHAGNAGRNVGLGLYIVRQLVEAHGGTVSVRSSSHEGTMFLVQLPVRAPL